MADRPRYPDSNGEAAGYPGAPRWVKVFGIIVAIPVLLFVILMLTRGAGGHGPGRHAPSGDVVGHVPPSSTAEGLAPSGGDGGGHTPPERGH